VNHIVRGHTKRGLGSLGIRAAGAATAATILGAIILGCVEGSGESNDCGGWAVLLPLGPLAAVIIDDAYVSRDPL